MQLYQNHPEEAIARPLRAHDLIPQCHSPRPHIMKRHSPAAGTLLEKRLIQLRLIPNDVCLRPKGLYMFCGFGNDCRFHCFWVNIHLFHAPAFCR